MMRSGDFITFRAEWCTVGGRFYRHEHLIDVTEFKLRADFPEWMYPFTSRVDAGGVGHVKWSISGREVLFVCPAHHVQMQVEIPAEIWRT